jgi:hypothetical protein
MALAARQMTGGPATPPVSRGGSWNIYSQFGPVKELANAGLGADNPFENAVSVAVREARARLSELVSGAKKFRVLNEMVSYLRDNFYTTEVHSHGGQNPTLVLRDDLTGKSVNGAAVHKKLTMAEVNKLGSKSALAKITPGPTAVESRYADSYRNTLQGEPLGAKDFSEFMVSVPVTLSRKTTLALIVSGGVSYAGRPGVDSRNPLRCLGTPDLTRTMLYEEAAKSVRAQAASFREAQTVDQFRAMPEDDQVAFLVANSDRFKAMTPVQRAAFLSTEVHPKTDPARTRERLYTEAAELVRGKVSDFRTMLSTGGFKSLDGAAQDAFLSKHFVFSTTMAPTTHVLLRDGFLARGEKIHPDLSAENIQNRLGEFDGYWLNHYETAKAHIQAEKDNVLPFRRAAAAAASTGGVILGRGLGRTFGGAAAPTEIAVSKAPIMPKSPIVIVQDDTSEDDRICRWNSNGNHYELPDYDTMHSLPAGVYPILAGGADVSRPTGFLVVENDRSLIYQDSQHREHRYEGPSRIPDPENRAGQFGWALDGVKMTENTHQEEMAAQAPDAGPGQPSDKDEPAFGYGAPGRRS